MKKLLVLGAALALCGSAGAETFQIDPVHSSVNFKIRHFVSKVRGKFTKFEGTIDYAPGKPETWKAQAKIDAASVDTGVEARDNHLRSDAFFDVKRCPELEFHGTKVHDVKGDSAKLDGLLTMRCVTKPVTLDVELGGVMDTPMGRRLGATATARIDRKDWDIVWNKTLDRGGTMLGDDVELELDVEAVADSGRKAGQARKAGKAGK